MPRSSAQKITSRQMTTTKMSERLLMEKGIDIYINISPRAYSAFEIKQAYELAPKTTSSPHEPPDMDFCETVKRLAKRKDADKVWLQNYLLYFCEQYMQLLER